MRPLFAVMACLFLMVACSNAQRTSVTQEVSAETPPAPSVQAPNPPPAALDPGPAPAAQATKPAPTAPAKERRTITLNPTEMTYDEAKGTCTFRPDGAVKRASYTRYVLDLASLERVLGSRPTAPVAVVVELEPAVTGTSKVDPSLPQPLGGFRQTTYKGVVVGVP